MPHSLTTFTCVGYRPVKAGISHFVMKLCMCDHVCCLLPACEDAYVCNGVFLVGFLCNECESFFV